MRNVLVLAFTILIGLPTVTAQSVPDFSGRWVAVQPVSIAGHVLRITQDNSTIRLEQLRLQSRQVYGTFGQRQGDAKGEQETTSYRLDGQPTITTNAANDPEQVRSSLRVEKDRLVLIDLYQSTGLRFERTLQLAAPDRLVLEKKRPPVTSDDPLASSAGILEPVRVVFERR
jgi:hypothetical protein